MTAFTLSLPFAAAAIVALSQAAGAQSLHRVTEPLRRVDLDLSTGIYTIERKVAPKGAPQFNTAISLTNIDFSGGVAIDSVQCEWFDSFTKGERQTGGKSQIMASFLFAYCSSALSVGSGGAGGSVTISFDEGYMTPPVGTPRPAFSTRTQVYNLSGLPAMTGCSSFFCGFQCYFIRIETATPGASPQTRPGSWAGGDALPDGRMGYAWDFRDVSTFQELAHTFPFLACVQSCSGSGPDNQTFEDGVDKYCGMPGMAGSPVTLINTFTFGTSPSHTSLSLEIREAQPIASATTPFNGTGVNPTATATGLAGPSLGNPWSVALDCSLSSTPSKPAILKLSFGAPTMTALPPFGEVHVGVGGGKAFFQAPHGSSSSFQFGFGTGSVPALPQAIPLDLSFLNACFVAQGFCGDSPNGYLTSSLVQTIGS